MGTGRGAGTAVAARLLRLMAWGAVAAGVWLLLPPQYGGQLGTTVVSGHSMEPTYWTGDLVVTWAGAEARPGDVAVYTVPEGEPGEGLDVVHRVESVDREGRLTMLGDNNDTPDMWHPTADDVRGRVLFHVPQGGLWMQRLLSPLALAMLCGVLVAAAVASGTPRGSRSTDDTDETDETDGPDDTAAGGGGSGSTTFPAPRLPWRQHAGARAPHPGPGRQRPASDQPADQPTRPWLRRGLVLVGGLAVATAGTVGTSTVASAASLGGVSSSDLSAFAVAARPVVQGAPAFTVSRQLTSDEPGRYCATLTVTNTGTAAGSWATTLDVATAPWTAEAVTSSYGLTSGTFVARTSWAVSGATLEPGASAQAGYCADRPPLELTDVAASVAVTSSDSSSYCATVTVSTTSTSWVRWRASIGPSTPGITPDLRLDAQPTNAWNVSTLSFSAATRTWVVAGSGSNQHVRSGSPATFGYCSPYSTGATGPTSVSVRITSGAGGGTNDPYCAEVTVSTTSSTWVRWTATLTHQTPGLTGNRYRLQSQPTNYWNATSTAFSRSGNAWSWTLEGASWNRFVKAGSPTTFGFCR